MKPATGSDLDRIAFTFGFERSDGESDDKFRQRVLSEIRKINEEQKRAFFEKRKKLIEQKGSVSLQDLFGENGLLSGDSK